MINLNNTKASQDSDIAVKSIKDNLDIFKKTEIQKLNWSAQITRFPIQMKSTNTTPIFKKDDRTDKVRGKLQTNQYTAKPVKNFRKIFT